MYKIYICNTKYVRRERFSRTTQPGSTSSSRKHEYHTVLGLSCRITKVISRTLRATDEIPYNYFMLILQAALFQHRKCIYSPITIPIDSSKFSSWALWVLRSKFNILHRKYTCLQSRSEHQSTADLDVNIQYHYCPEHTHRLESDLKIKRILYARSACQW